MTAILEFQKKEDLDKLLKTAKIYGIYTKQRKVNSLSAVKKIYRDEKEWKMRRRALVLLKEIQQEAKISGLDKMTLEEINAEIAQARRESEMREKCFA